MAGLGRALFFCNHFTERFLKKGKCINNLFITRANFSVSRGEKNRMCLGLCLISLLIVNHSNMLAVNPK